MKAKILLPFLLASLVLGGCSQNKNNPEDKPSEPEVVDPDEPGTDPVDPGTDPAEPSKVESSKVEIVFGDVYKNATDNFNIDSLTEKLVVEGVTFDFKKNSGSNSPIYHVKNKEIRLYAKNSMTVSKEGISRIDFQYAAENGTIESDVGTYVAGGSTTGKWTGEADQIVFTVTNKQRRILSMTVYCGEIKENEEEASYPQDTANSYTVDFEHLGLTNSLQESQKNFSELMTGYLSKERNEVTSIAYEGKVQIYHKAQEYQGKVYEVLALQVGSASDAGTLTINFSKNLSKVKLYSSPNFAFAYDKDSGEFVPSCDGYCRITVNNEEWVLGQFDADKGIERSEKEFTINSNKLTLSGNASERVYTYAMTFTF